MGASVEGRDLGSVVNELNDKLKGVSFERGYHAEVLGEYNERQAAQSRLLTSSIIAGVLILLLLQTSFRSWRLAILVFLTLPMALVGGVLAAWLAGGSSRSGLSWGSSRCSESQPVTASCSSTTASTWRRSRACPSVSTW